MINIKIGNGITVKVNCNYKTFDLDLKSKGLKIIQEYGILNDVYMLPNDIKVEAIDNWKY